MIVELQGDVLLVKGDNRAWRLPGAPASLDDPHRQQFAQQRGRTPLAANLGHNRSTPPGSSSLYVPFRGLTPTAIRVDPFQGSTQNTIRSPQPAARSPQPAARSPKPATNNQSPIPNPPATPPAAVPGSRLSGRWR